MHPTHLNLNINIIDSNTPQSRGRARHPRATYVVMEEITASGSDSAFAAVRRCALQMGAVSLPMLTAEMNHALADAKRKTLHLYEVPRTGALVSLNGAVALVHQYCDSLPRDQYCSLQPHFQLFHDETCGLFWYKLTLPGSSPVGEIKGPKVLSKALAKQCVCLLACRKLHQCEGLDDYLLPPRPKPTYKLFTDVYGQSIERKGRMPAL